MTPESWLLIAASLTIVIGLVHSLLGEQLIFKQLRQGTIVPTNGKPVLRERHLRILWASWHLVSIFGFAFAAVLIAFATAPDVALDRVFLLVTTITMAMSALLVLFATKGMHPGWVGLTLVALFTVLAQ